MPTKAQLIHQERFQFHGAIAGINNRINQLQHFKYISGTERMALISSTVFFKIILDNIKQTESKIQKENA